MALGLCLVLALVRVVALILAALRLRRARRARTLRHIALAVRDFRRGAVRFFFLVDLILAI